MGMVGWASFLISPPVVGATADAFSLRIALGGIAIVVFLVAPLGFALRRDREREPAVPLAPAATE
jgi:hypothetical protein